MASKHISRVLPNGYFLIKDGAKWEVRRLLDETVYAYAVWKHTGEQRALWFYRQVRSPEDVTECLERLGRRRLIDAYILDNFFYKTALDKLEISPSQWVAFEAERCILDGILPEHDDT